MTDAPWWRWGRWVLAGCGLVAVFLLYSHSFNTFPILERRHSVLADADAAPFALMLQDFSPGRKFGDEYNTNQRSIGDIAQKHKTHHFLYVFTGSLVFQALRDAYAIVGLDPHQALYGVNALIACANLVLLFLLLRHFGRPGVERPVFGALYVVALSTWIYASIPESWPFTATLALGFLVLWFTRRPHYLLMAVYIGVAMLNNLLLGSLGIFLFLRRLRDRPERPVVAVGEAALALLVMVVVWTAGLTGLSVFDDSLRPDRFIAYTFWFKEFTGGGLPISDPYVWKTALTNLFINPITSHQPDPFVPHETLLTTIRTSRLGLLAVLAYVAVMGTALWNALTQLRAVRAGGQGWRTAILADDGLHLAIYCAAFAVLVMIMFFGAGFLYSCVTVPILVLLLARYLDPTRRAQRWLLYASVAIIAFNNALQIAEFRAALAPLG